MNHEQEKTLSEVTKNLYKLAKICGMDEDFVQEWKTNITSDIEKVTGLSEN